MRGPGARASCTRRCSTTFADLSGYQVYACGGPAMIDAARKAFIGARALPAEEFFADSFTLRGADRDAALGAALKAGRRRPLRAPRPRASAPRRDARWPRRRGRVAPSSSPSATCVAPCRRRARGSPRDTSAPCPRAAARWHSMPSACSSTASWLCCVSQRSACSSWRVASAVRHSRVELDQRRSPSRARGSSRGSRPPRDRRRAARKLLAAARAIFGMPLRCVRQACSSRRAARRVVRSAAELLRVRGGAHDARPALAS